MRSIVLNKMMNFVDNGSYTKEELEKIHYGFECIYIFITKGIVIFTIAYFLGILKYTALFSLFFGLIRSFACGLHAKSSISCLIFSTLLFIIIPYLCKVLVLNKIINIILLFVSTVLIYIYAPADTKKRPIINQNKRKRQKYISISIALSYIIASIFIEKGLILNTLSFSLTLESIMILPITYKIFKLPYNNYKSYLESHKLEGRI